MKLPTLPNATTGTATTPRWVAEPAKKVGDIVGGVAAAGGLALAGVAEFLPVLPDNVRTEVAAVIAIGAGVVAALTRVQALLTRARVFSPRTVERIDPAALNGHTHA